jgi:hypothetical protein
MYARLIKAVSMIAGLLALLLCVAVPAAAHEMPMTQAHALMPSDMPCCPEKAPASSKACGQQCPLLAQADFRFEHRARVSRFSFAVTRDDFASRSYQPLAPPPR